MTKKDMYRMRDILELIEGNQNQDIRNPEQAMKRREWIEEGRAIINKYLYKMKP